MTTKTFAEELELALAKEIIKNEIMKDALKEIDAFQPYLRFDAFAMKNMASKALKDAGEVK